MAFLTLQLNAPGINVGVFNSALSGGTTKPLETLQNIINILYGLEGGLKHGSISVSSSTVAGTVSGQTGGTAAFTISFS